VRWSERYIGGLGRNHFPALEVPRLIPLVLLEEVLSKEGKAFGCEEGKGLGSGLCYEQRREVERGLYCL
jgi:hypothetical protein